VAVDQRGNVYVTDDATDDLVEFSSKGDLRDVWGTQGSQPGEFVNPSGVAVDDRGNVYVGDTGNDRIQTLRASLGP
jgi:DNA-binding beta-propeller fold protein YncE